jgi:hypothetical protein
MTECDAMELLRYLQSKGYVVHAEFHEVDGHFRWTVLATKRRK